MEQHLKDKKYKILIVGAGIGGLTAAAFLRRDGHQITLVDKTLKWGMVGYSLTVWPNGLEIFDELGIGKKIRDESIAVPGYKYLTKNGKELAHFSLSRVIKEFEAPITIDRPDLHAILLEANKGNHVMMGRTVRSLENQKEKVKVVFTDRSSEHYDLVIGADGINSEVRNQIFKGAFKKYLGVSGWLFWVPHKMHFPKEFVTYLGNGNVFGMYPHKSQKKMAVFVAKDAASAERSLACSTETKKILKEYKGLGERMMAYVPKKDCDMFYHHHFEVETKKWVKGRVALLGDAAHALSPFSGMGVSMAAEDSRVLSRMLQKFDDPEKALKEYEKVRMERIKKIKSGVNFFEFLAKQKGFLQVFIRNIFLRIFYQQTFIEYMIGILRKRP